MGIYDSLIEQQEQTTGITPPKPTGASNIYDNILTTEQDNVRKYRSAVMEAVKTSPDRAAHVQKIAKELMLPTEVVDRNVDDLDKLARARRLELMRSAQDDPVLARQLSDPDFAKIAQDDTDNLSFTGKVFKFFRDTVTDAEKGFKSGRLINELGFLGERAKSGEDNKAMWAKIAELQLKQKQLKGTGGFIESAAQIVGQQFDTMPDVAMYGLQAATAAGGATAIAGQLGPQAVLPEEIITVPAAMVAGFTAGSIAKMSEQSYRIEAGASYLDMLESGVDKDVAKYVSTGVGMVNAALEVAGMKFVAAPFKKLLIKETTEKISKSLTKPTMQAALKQFGKDYAGAVLGETSTEVLQEISNVIGEEIGRSMSDMQNLVETEEGRKQIGERLSGIFEQVTKGMAVLALPGAGLHFRKEIGRVKDAEKNATFFDSLAQGADTSKVLERNPDAYHSFISNQAADAQVENIYIDGKVFAQTLNQHGIKAEELDQVVPGLSEKVQAAALTGGDVVMSTADYATHLAKADLGKAMLPHVRTDASALSVAEATQAGSLAQQLFNNADQVMQKNEERKEWVRSANEVQKTMFDQIKGTGAYSDPVSRLYAATVKAFYVNLADRNGTTPMEAYQAHPYKVEMGELGQGQSGITYSQEGNINIDENFKNWFGESKVVDAEGKPLVVYHGSPDARFMKDDATFKNRWTGKTKGAHWFTPSKQTAKTYADDTRAFDYQNAEPNIIPAYLSMKNPLIVEANGANWRDAQRRGETSNVIKEAQEQGHDGVIIRNVKDDYNNGVKTKPTDTYVVFDSTQIKSVNNRGTFDPNNPNILHQSVDEYGGEHRPPGPDDGAPLYDLTGSGAIYPDDIYSAKGLQYYGTGDDKADRESMSVIHSTHNKPNATVTIYRAVPKKPTNAEQISKLEKEKAAFMKRGKMPVDSPFSNGSKWYEWASSEIERLQSVEENPAANIDAINAGDWVTLSKSYAKDHGEGALNGKYKIISKKVKASELFTNGDSINEFGYWPATKESMTLYQSAWHGSPHTFDKFSTSAIGTGEGAQAYGYGLYFAGAKDVAEWYRDKLAGQQSTLIIDGQEFGNTQQEYSQAADVDRLIMDAYIGIGKGYKSKKQLVAELKSRAKGAFKNWKPIFKEAIAKAQTDAVDINTEKGKLYKVELAPAEDEYLLWDKPLSEQSEKVRGILTDRTHDMGEYYSDAIKIANENGTKIDPKGNTIYQEIAQQFSSDRAASEYLHSLGIRGIKYEDGNTRNKDGEKNHNYVIFSDDDVAIQEMYQKMNGRKRGGYDPSRLTTILTQDTDYSTFLHETGHFFLDTYSKIASDPNAPAAIKEDMQTILNWFGIESLEAWNAMDLEQQRQYHEQFAYNFEIWVAEGKSPSIKMESVFRTFGRFLKQVYENIRDELNDVYRQEHGKDLPILTGEVRQVMERMLASEKQIKEGEQVRAMAPIFEVQPESMSDEEWAAYREMQQQAHDNALDEHTRASLRSLKWLEGAKSRVFKALQNQAKEARDGIKSEVTEYIKKMPVYRAISFIKRGEYDVQEDANQKAKRAGTEMGMGSTKLSIAALKEMYGEEANAIWRHLSTGPNGLIATDGVHPDVVAEMFGFKSGDEMVREILASKPMKDAINEETDRRMLEEHDELTDPDAIQEAVDRAIHNDLRAKFIGVELRHLAKTQRPVRVMQEAARRAAVQMLDTMRLKDLRPSDYAAAEAKASKAADAALKKGDIAAATTAKEQQLLQNQLASEALKLKEQMKKDLQYLEKIQKDSARKKMGPEAADQIDMLLEKFDLKPPSMKQADEIAKFKTWVKSQLNQGQIPDMAVNLLSPEERRAFSAEMEMRDEEGELIYKDEEDAALMLAEAIDKSAKRPYYDLTFDEWQGLVDTVRNIHHLGKTKTMMLAMADGLSYEQTRDEIANSIVINAKKGGKNTRTAADWLGKKFEALKQFGASHIKVATWARIMDGGKDDGPMWRFFIQTANERANWETTQRAAATEKLAAILAPILKKVPVSDKVGKGRYFESIGESLNWEARMAIAMNYGNDSNLQRLLDGMGWTIEQIMPVLNSLTLEEWKAAEAIGAHFESYRPQIAEKEKRVTGKEPKWIEPREFAVMTADGQRFTSKGWYYPVVFDPRLSLAASQHAAAEESKNQMKAAYNAATTRRSFVKERVEKVVGRPVLLTLQGLYSGVNDVVHDLAWHEWVIDANKLLRSKSIDGAIREHYGPEIKKEFEKWRDDIVAGTRRLDHSIEKAAGFFRQSVSMAGLGFNIVSALMQPFGLINSGVRIGHRWMGHGIAQYISNGPAALTREVKSISSFMDNRARTRFRELNELRNQIQGQTAVKEVMGRYAYWMMMQTQQIVDVITWKAAYDKAMSEGHFKADEDGVINDRTAINLADQAVKDAQGGGEEIDQAGVERGGPLIKLFTTFYSFMATTANVAFLEGMTEKSRAKAAVNIILVLSIQPMLGALLKDMLTPGGDDDDEKIAKKLAAEQISFLLGLVAFGREFSQAGRILAGDGKGMGYSGPPGLRMISDVYKLAAQARQGEFDVAFAKAFVNVLGDTTGMPSVQVNRLITGAKALSEGKTKNPAALIMGYQNQ